MPAETHQHRSTDRLDDVLELFDVLLAPPDADRVDPSLTLHQLGITEEPMFWALWDAVVEEFGERGSSEAGDPDDLREASTLDELARVFVRWLRSDDET